MSRRTYRGPLCCSVVSGQAVRACLACRARRSKKPASSQTCVTDQSNTYELQDFIQSCSSARTAGVKTCWEDRFALAGYKTTRS